MNSVWDTSVGESNEGLATAMHAGFVLWKKNFSFQYIDLMPAIINILSLWKAELWFKRCEKAFLKKFYVVAVFY